MLSRIEKLLILKTVGIFLETPDDVLAEVAALLDEVDAPAGSTIIHKAIPAPACTSSSTARCACTTRRIRSITCTRDVFGEIALLDPEPRVASVAAVSDTQLLRLDQEPFYELTERTTRSRGIIRMLTRHLRARVRDLAEARAEIGAAPASAAPAGVATSLNPR